MATFGYPLEDGELLMASMHGDVPATKSLLRENANIEVKGPNQVRRCMLLPLRQICATQATPLLLAARNGMSSMVRLLLESRAQARWRF